MSICERVSLFFCTMFRNNVEEEEEDEEDEEKEEEEEVKEVVGKLKHTQTVKKEPFIIS